MDVDNSDPINGIQSFTVVHNTEDSEDCIWEIVSILRIYYDHYPNQGVLLWGTVTTMGGLLTNTPIGVYF